MFAPDPPIFWLFVTDKGKPVEKQGRKVSGLMGKTYDSGAAGFDSGCSCIDDSRSDCVDRKFGSGASHPKPQPRRPERCGGCSDHALSSSTVQRH
jgi:hypothetical protein